jgi:serine protease
MIGEALAHAGRARCTFASGTITTDLGAAGRDDVFGLGLIDARRAVEAVIASAPDEPILLVNPTGLNLGTSQTQASFQATNGAGGALSLTSVTDDQPWLSVVATAVDGNGLGTYQVNVDRTGLATGTYTGSISVNSSAGSASVSVVMAVVSSASGANAGLHYVLLVDPTSLEPVAQIEVAASGGGYPLR